MWKGLTKKQKNAYEVRAVQDQGVEEEGDGILGPRGAVQPQADVLRPRVGAPANPPVADLPLADPLLAEPLLAGESVVDRASGEDLVERGGENVVELATGQDQEDVLDGAGGEGHDDVFDRVDEHEGGFDEAGGQDLQLGANAQHLGAVPKTRGKRHEAGPAIGNFKCAKCDYNGSTRGELETHMRTHLQVF